MSNAKVRARRRRRANRAWTQAMTPIELRLTDRYFLQADCAWREWRELDRLLREKYPTATFVHDSIIIDDPLFTPLTKERCDEILKNWHKGWYLPISADDADMPNWDDRSEHVKDHQTP